MYYGFSVLSLFFISAVAIIQGFGEINISKEWILTTKRVFEYDLQIFLLFFEKMFSMYFLVLQICHIIILYFFLKFS